MQIRTVKIEDLVEVPDLKNLYAEQPIDDLMTSLEQDGQKTPIHVTRNLEIINGYRLVSAMKNLGYETVQAIIMDGNPTIYDRITLNTTRVKTVMDKVTEIRLLFKKFPKKQGQKSTSGEKYSRDEQISNLLNNRWKGDKVIKKLEYILDNDLSDSTLSKGIVEKNWKIEPCYQFLTEFKEIDEKRNYGFADKLQTGTLNIEDTVKLIKQKKNLDDEYADTFVIPEIAKSYRMNALDLSNLNEHKKTVDLLLTSPPYYILRKYQSETIFQIGHEKNVVEYCSNVTSVIQSLVPTLKETASVIINIGETYDNGVGYGVPYLLKSTIESNTSLTYVDTLIWSKPNSKPQNENVRRPNNNVEYLLWFVVDPKKYKYNLLKYTISEKQSKISRGCKDTDKNGVIWDKNISLAKPYQKIYTHLKEQEIAEIVECSVGKNHEVYKIYEAGHPAIMSALLPVIPILMTTDESDVVLDPFSGSNVVGRISLLLNRQVLSTELSKEYFNIGCRMLENASAEFDRESLNIISKTFLEKYANESDIKIAA